LLLLAVGLLGRRFSRRTVLLSSAVLMCVTGIAFYLATGFWALLIVAFVGTLNPSSGDVTLFLPTEQAVLAEAAAPVDRTNLFAWYNLAGALAGALGSLAAGLPDAVAPGSAVYAERAAFLLYAAFGALSALAYRKLSPAIEPPPASQAYVMAMVPREERAAAARVTNVPRSLASAIAPLLAGGLLQRSLFGWPLVFAGLLKAGYDLALFAKFAQRKPSEAGG